VVHAGPLLLSHQLKDMLKLLKVDYNPFQNNNLLIVQEVTEIKDVKEDGQIEPCNTLKIKELPQVQPMVIQEDKEHAKSKEVLSESEELEMLVLVMQDSNLPLIKCQLPSQLMLQIGNHTKAVSSQTVEPILIMPLLLLVIPELLG